MLSGFKTPDSLHQSQGACHSRFLNPPGPPGDSSPVNGDPPLGLLTLGLDLGAVGLEVPGGDALHEHLVEFLVAAAAGLGLVPPQKRDAGETEAAEDETHLAAQVGLVRVEQVGQDEGPHDADALLGADSQGHRLDAQARRRRLGQAGERRRADGQVVQPAVDEDHGDGGAELHRRPTHGQAAHHPEHHGQAHGAVDGQGATPHRVDQVPGDDIAEHGEHLLDDLELERHRGAVSRQLGVVGAVAGREHDAGELLHAQRRDGDERAAEVGLAEALEVGGPVGFAPHFLQRDLDVRQPLGVIAARGVVAEAMKAAERLVFAAFARQPPW